MKINCTHTLYKYARVFGGGVTWYPRPIKILRLALEYGWGVVALYLKFGRS